MELDTEQTLNATQLSNILKKCLTINSRKKRVNNNKTLLPVPPKAKHQRPQNMVTAQATTQIVEERDHTRTYPKNLPETNADA